MVLCEHTFFLMLWQPLLCLILMHLTLNVYIFSYYIGSFPNAGESSADIFGAQCYMITNLHLYNEMLCDLLYYIYKCFLPF